MYRFILVACSSIILVPIAVSAGELSNSVATLCHRADQNRLDAKDHAICAAVSKAVQRNQKPTTVLARVEREPAVTPAPAIPGAPLTTPGCYLYPKSLFVRADPLDNFHYLVDPQDPLNPSAADAKGASVSYTNDRNAGTQTAVINGRVSYLLYGAHCQPEHPRQPFLLGYGIAPFASGNGTWNEPIKKGSNSSVKTGVDFQTSFSTTLWVLKDHYLYISPFYQTDLRGLARAQGVTFAYEPVAPSLALGASGSSNPYYRFFWQFRAQSDVLQVTDPGMTNLSQGGQMRFGAIVRANLGLFPVRDSQNTWPDWLVGRISLIGTGQYFRDSSKSLDLPYYSLALQYKLGPCKNADPTTPAGQEVIKQCDIIGSSSISLEYDHGTDKDTLANVNQFLLKLGYAY